MALLVQRLVEHPSRQRHDELAALRLRHEVGGKQQTANGVLPTDQRLHPGRPLPVGQVHDGLEMQDELTARDADPKLAQQRQPIGGLVTGLRREDGQSAPRGLGLVQRQIGATHQLGGRAAVLGEEGDSDARVNLDGVPADQDRRIEALADLPGDRRRRRCVGPVAREDAELVATQAGHRVDIAHQAPQPLTDGTENLVAALAPEALVDLAKAVQIDDQHAARAVRPGRRRDRLVKPVAEQGAGG